MDLFGLFGEEEDSWINLIAIFIGCGLVWGLFFGQQNQRETGEKKETREKKQKKIDKRERQVGEGDGCPNPDCFRCYVGLHHQQIVETLSKFCREGKLRKVKIGQTMLESPLTPSQMSCKSASGGHQKEMKNIEKRGEKKEKKEGKEKFRNQEQKEERIREERGERLIQQPTVFEVMGLESSPFHSHNQFENFLFSLEESSSLILQEYQTAQRNQKENLISEKGLGIIKEAGGWERLFLYNEGVSVPENCIYFPKTLEILFRSGSRYIVKNARFGNIFFSLLKPGTYIPPHYGPCNARLRLHLALSLVIPSSSFRSMVKPSSSFVSQFPTQMGLQVAGEKIEWMEGKSFIFDDSFEHEAWNFFDLENPQNGGRLCLIVDIWHPSLLLCEKISLCSAFPV